MNSKILAVTSLLAGGRREEREKTTDRHPKNTINTLAGTDQPSSQLFLFASSHQSFPEQGDQPMSSECKLMLPCIALRNILS